MSSTRLLSSLIAAAPLLLPMARAQDALFTLEGDQAGEGAGSFRALCAVPDVDGDGRRDLLVGGRWYDGVAGVDSGRVRLLSGATRAEIRSFEGENAGDSFGVEAEDVLDLDGDGVDEIAIGAIGYPAGAETGKVYVYSGATGALLQQWVGENVGDQFCRIRGVGDATGDGVNDLLVTANGFGPSTPGNDDGKVYLYSGADGTLANSWTGATSATLGYTRGRLGFDVDGDGAVEFAVGTYELSASPGNGHVYVYSGKSQTPLVTISGANAGDKLGFTDDAADVDGDGIPDLLVGSPYFNGNTGVAYVYSGKDWSVVRTWYGSAAIHLGGTVIGMAGDIDGDGHGDVLLGYATYDGVAGHDSGLLQLFSGANGRLLTRWEGERANDLLGFPVHDAGDLDGDGIPDLLTAATQFDGAAGADCGKVYALQGNDLYFDVTPSVASAGDTVTLTTTAGVPGNFVIDVLVELDGAPMFTLLTPVLTFDGNGELVISGVVDPSFGPHTLTLQSLALGRAGKLIDSSSRALVLQ